MKFHYYQPVFLIGAARSGTKLLRDVIANHPSIDRVPYDINFIWRLGNEATPHDKLTPEQISPVIAKRITRKLASFCKGAPYLIEKTVSNCLRVPFLDALFPNAKYIFLVRDGRDVVESSYRQWTAKPDMEYVFKKAFSYPLLDAPGYAFSYAIGMFRKFFSRNSRHVPTWGPRYAGIDQDVKTKHLIEVCGIQWAKSVEKAAEALQRINPDRVYEVRYEEFVQNPDFVLHDLGNFLGLRLNSNGLEVITTENIGKGWDKLHSKQQEWVYPLIREALELTGYYCDERPEILRGELFRNVEI